VPTPTSPVSPTGPNGPATAGPTGDGEDDPAERVRYLDQVMAEIDAEVRRRRASGDLPAGLERELDELFLEFSPVGLHGRGRLRETLTLVDGSAHVDIAVPVESQKMVGSYVKRLIRQGLGWYMGFIVHQIVKFAWAVSRMLHVVVDHIEDLEATVEAHRTPDLPADVVPRTEPGRTWWAGAAVAALGGLHGRVVHADCGDGSLVAALLDAGVDAYGIDPSETAIEPALDRGLDARCETILDHLGVVADEVLGALVLSGSVQWLRPNEREQLVDLAASRLTLDGVLVLHSATPESWSAAVEPMVRDLAPGGPIHVETWAHLLGCRGFSVEQPLTGGVDRRLARVSSTGPDAAALNATIDTINELFLGPGEYLVVATRER